MKLHGFIDIERQPVFVHVDSIRSIEYDSSTGGSQITYVDSGVEKLAFAPAFKPIDLFERLTAL